MEKQKPALFKGDNLESFAMDELGEYSTVLLSEATWEDITVELERRFSDFLFAGVTAYPWTTGEKDEGNFISGSCGGYVAKRGLLHVLKEKIQLETDEVHGGFFFDDEEEGDDVSYT